MTKVWNCDGESPLRRYNPRGPPYHISQDRYLPAVQPDGTRHSGRGYSDVPRDASHDDHESEPDPKGSRRRIPVACGRCRKRKIRCSGPQGDGGCQNCKNAGSSECQFNRVQSEEVPFRDSTVDYGYNTDLARAVHCRSRSQLGSYRLQSPGCPQGLMPINPSLTYRTQSLPDYQYPKSACFLPTFETECNEDGLEYTLSGSAYPFLGQENAVLSSNYGSHGTTRGWAPATQPAKTSANGMYYEPDATATYGQSQFQYNNQAYGMRSTGITEPNHFSFSGMASSLPTSSSTTNNDGILPATPAKLVPIQRSVDGLSYSGNSLKTVNNHNMPGSQLMAGGHNYLPLSSCPDSAVSYCSSGLPANLGHQHQDVYSPGESWNAAPLSTESNLRSQEPSSELYYGPGNDCSRKALQSNLRAKDSSSELYYKPGSEGSQKASQGSQSTVTGLLNGHIYQVGYPQDAHAPQLSRSASMDTGRGAGHRRSNGSLRAA